jgi:hypothetical protein
VYIICIDVAAWKSGDELNKIPIKKCHNNTQDAHI